MNKLEEAIKISEHWRVKWAPSSDAARTLREIETLLHAELDRQREAQKAIDERIDFLRVNVCVSPDTIGSAARFFDMVWAKQVMFGEEPKPPTTDLRLWRELGAW